MVTMSQLVRQGIPTSVAQAIVQGWLYRQVASYMRPNPRRYGSRSKYIPAGPNKNTND